MLTSGDFNGDGYADLVAGDTGEFTSSGADCGGAVWIFYGSATGLGLDRPQQFNQDTPGVPGDMGEFEAFGEASAAGDVNGEDWDDLAVSAPMTRSTARRTPARLPCCTAVWQGSLVHPCLTRADVGSSAPVTVGPSPRSLDFRGPS